MDNCRCGVKGEPFAVSIETRASGCLGYVGDCTTQLCRDWNDNRTIMRIWLSLLNNQFVFFSVQKVSNPSLYAENTLSEAFFASEPDMMKPPVFQNPVIPSVSRTFVRRYE